MASGWNIFGERLEEVPKCPFMTKLDFSFFTFLTHFPEKIRVVSRDVGPRNMLTPAEGDPKFMIPKKKSIRPLQDLVVYTGQAYPEA